jgi:hypothetical protein
MNHFTRVGLQSLPVNAANGINREKFLFSYYVPEKNRYVIRHVNPTTKKGEELEFDVEADRFLSIEERLKELPAPNTKVYTEKDIDAYAAYYIRPPSNEMWVHFDIHSKRKGKKVAEAEQQVYAPNEWNIASIVTAAVDKADFPKQYASWDEDRKVGYWASMIHRYRRWNGETGIDEDEVFSPSLLKDMEKTDPNVRFLLPKILTLAAHLEQTDPEALIRSFSERVGTV